MKNEREWETSEVQEDGDVQISGGAGTQQPQLKIDYNLNCKLWALQDFSVNPYQS